MTNSNSILPLAKVTVLFIIFLTKLIHKFGLIRESLCREKFLDTKFYEREK